MTSKLGIRARLFLGFAAITLTLATAAAITVWKVKGIEAQTTRIVELRVPRPFASTGIKNDIIASLNSSRGWVLTGNRKSKMQRLVVWDDVARVGDEMDTHLESWASLISVEKWAELKPVFGEFAVAQQDAATSEISQRVLRDVRAA